MRYLANKEYEGERPLYAEKELHLEHVTVHEGESALKESEHIKAMHCLFEGRYPFWCCKGADIGDCRFTIDARAPLWYSTDISMKDCEVLSPKPLRELHGVSLTGCRFPQAVETLWMCQGVKMSDCSLEGADYFGFRSSGIEAGGLHLKGKYTFQYCRDVVIRNSVLDTKDAFWESDNVCVMDSEVRGEYLGWYSRNLKLVRCHISGTQPLCYAKGLVLEDCTFAPDADLAFEYSEVQATINSRVASVKNPLSGHIKAQGYGEIILDEYLRAPGDCLIN